MTLREISEKTGLGVLQSTCSKIIQIARERASENGIEDLCATEHLKPLQNSVKGSNEALPDAEKAHLVETTLLDAEHCRMTVVQLAEAGMYTNILLYKIFIEILLVYVQKAKNKIKSQSRYQLTNCFQTPGREQNVMVKTNNKSNPKSCPMSCPAGLLPCRPCQGLALSNFYRCVIF